MPQQSVSKPTYLREDISVGIAHIGVGNFHRSHQAVYLDQLMNSGLDRDWGICGIGLLPGDARMRDTLKAQDYSYTVIEKHGDGAITARVIGSIVDYLYAPDEPEAVIELLSSPAIKIVSLTITEGGYNIDRTTGAFLVTSQAIQEDIAKPVAPTTVFGYLTQALARRRQNGIAPFTVMSCDNVPENGNVAKLAVTSFAREIDPDLATWIAGHVSFPNSMVDRITPVTADADRHLLQDFFGIEDAWPVPTEPFTQWVLEDTFSCGRPAFENVGVQMVNDVAAYELMKLRLLNASHQGLAYFGTLLGYTYVHEAVADPGIANFLRGYLAEARQTLLPVPGIDLDTYVDQIFVRFLNPHIADTLARLAVDASDRIPKFVLPTIRDNLSAGRSMSFGAALIASWREWLESTSPVAIVDALTPELLDYVDRSRQDPSHFISCTSVFGDLAWDEAFTNEVRNVGGTLRRGTREWLDSLPMY